MLVVGWESLGEVNNHEQSRGAGEQSGMSTHICMGTIERYAQNIEAWAKKVQRIEAWGT